MLFSQQDLNGQSRQPSDAIPKEEIGGKVDETRRSGTYERDGSQLNNCITCAVRFTLARELVSCYSFSCSFCFSRSFSLSPSLTFRFFFLSTANRGAHVLRDSFLAPSLIPLTIEFSNKFVCSFVKSNLNILLYTIYNLSYTYHFQSVIYLLGDLVSYRSPSCFISTQI